ncbi:FAD-dependent oxidoreductase [Xenophilus arseniciresistens]|uniref:FAD-dependent oxidoreductase n=1 Tax=Xenophilus arseniciresistens TaxID=1283306 RepID=A0AAE3NBD0_9BURK|nr:NAD(P)-binding protein [Xenophilus arseniciresistens]MDA7419230.1 FAD-dependent oxidoreductase [Xenophilus arseniciresistens]
MKRRAFLGAGAAGTLALAGCDAAAPAIEGGFTGIDVARGHAWRDGAGRSSAAPARTQQCEVLIAGGGIAGLAAARALRLQGIEDFALLELEDGAGGNARGGSVGGLACPLGAHYLPVPGDDAHEVQDLLEELGLRQRVAGRWVYDERHLCHSPQERLYFEGQWQEGLLPVHGVGEDTLAQYRLLARQVAALRRAQRFAIPAFRAPWTPELAALEARPFAQWLAQQGLDDPQLLWYLDYCCRDDYGAGIAHVSAWAGLHYFASRHGFHAPGDTQDEDGEREAVFTWPEGNGWLSARLAAPLGDRLRSAHAVTRITELRDGVQVDAWDARAQQTVRWQARRCIVALPAFIAARVVEGAPGWLQAAARHISYAPWLVANAHLRAPLQDRPGAAPSWDNVVFGTQGLGYVDAGHQRLDPSPQATVLSWYRPLGPSRWDGASAREGRQRLFDAPWTHWRDQMLAELSVPHPDLAEKITRMAITRYGHAMAIPTPGLRAHLPQPEEGRPGRLRAGRLAFAHADWSGYSIFEEAFTRGHLAAQAQA